MSESNLTQEPLRVSPEPGAQTPPNDTVPGKDYIASMLYPLSVILRTRAVSYDLQGRYVFVSEDNRILPSCSPPNHHANPTPLSLYGIIGPSNFTHFKNVGRCR